MNYASSPNRVKGPSSASTLSPGSASSHGGRAGDAFVYSPSLAPNNPFLADIQAANNQASQPVHSPLPSPHVAGAHPAASSPQATFLPVAHGGNTVMSQTHTQPISVAKASGQPVQPPPQAATRKHHKVKQPASAPRNVTNTRTAESLPGPGFTAAAAVAAAANTSAAASSSSLAGSVFANTSAPSATTNIAVDQATGPAPTTRKNLQLPVIGRPALNVDITKQQASPDSSVIPVVAKPKSRKKRSGNDARSPSAATDELSSTSMTSQYSAQSVATVEKSVPVSLHIMHFCETLSHAELLRS